MNKRVRIGLIAVFCLAAVTWLFPFSFFSVYKSVTFKSDPIFIEDYQNEIEQFKKVHDREDRNKIKAHTNYLLDELYSSDLAIAKNVKVNRKNLDDALTTVRNMQTTLIRFSFDEELSEESREYLELSIYDSLHLQDDIRKIKGPNFYTRFELDKLIGNLQDRLKMSFDMYTHFYLTHYGLE